MPEKYERKCKNWLRSFGDWTLPRSQAPETILFWTGIFTLASAVRRHVYVGKKYLGGWICYPHVYVLFVSPPGVVNKSTTIDFAEDLLDSLGTNITKAPESLSAPVLIEALVASPDSSVYVIASDFPMLIQKAGNAMYETLTRLFDGAKKFGEGTISRGIKLVESPVANFIGGANPKWITANIPEDVLGGGFASRIIPIYEEEPREYSMYYRKRISQEGMEKLGNDLKEDLEYIANNIYGEFELTEEAEDFMENWYQRVHVPQSKNGDPKMFGFFVRKPAYVHKIAMLWRISYSDELLLTKEDFEFALQIMAQVEPRVRKTFKNIGKNRHISTIDGIETFVKTHRRVLRSELFEAFAPDAEPGKMNELLEGLVIMDKVKCVTHKGETWYIDPTIDVAMEFREIAEGLDDSESQAFYHSLYHSDTIPQDAA